MGNFLIESSMPQRTKAYPGFTLVEIMIVVVIIGMLAAMAVPAFQQVRERSQNSALANDLRIFAEAFETYAMEYGSYPADAGVGVVPAEMLGEKSSLDVVKFTATTPVGGRYDWDENVFGFAGAVSVTDTTMSTAQLQQFDADFDDGNLSTGQFRGNTSRYSYILESDS